MFEVKDIYNEYDGLPLPTGFLRSRRAIEGLYPSTRQSTMLVHHRRWKNPPPVAFLDGRHHPLRLPTRIWACFRIAPFSPKNVGKRRFYPRMAQRPKED